MVTICRKSYTRNDVEFVLFLKIVSTRLKQRNKTKQIKTIRTK